MLAVVGRTWNDGWALYRIMRKGIRNLGTHDCGRRPLGFQSRSSSSSVMLLWVVVVVVAVVEDMVISRVWDSRREDGRKQKEREQRMDGKEEL